MALICCQDCRGTAFTEIHGDLTCTSCGLVCTSGMIDDHAYTETSLCSLRDNILQKSDIRKNRLIDGARKTLNGLPFFDDDFIDCVCNWLSSSDLSAHNFASYAALTTIYASIYFRRGVNPDVISGIFGVNSNNIWPFGPQLLAQWRDKPWINQLKALLDSDSDKFDRLKRDIYNCYCIPPKMRFTVVKKCDRIWNKIKVNPQIECLKSSSLFATLIWIATKSCSIDVSMEQLCTEFNVSSSTIKQTEKLVQLAIVSSNKRIVK